MRAGTWTGDVDRRGTPPLNVSLVVVGAVAGQPSSSFTVFHSASRAMLPSTSRTLCRRTTVGDK